jgi:glycosyltransferase involved in cell wall biosynthesis
MNFNNKLELTDDSSNHHPRIAIILAQLGGGGIQRMRLNIIDRLVECGYAVDLVVGKDDGPLAECVPEGIPVYTVANEGKIWFFFGLLNYLRKRSPTHVLSSYEDISVMAIAANWLLGSRIYMLISTHSAISQLPYVSGWLNFLKYSVMLFPIMRLLYPKVPSLVAVSEGVAVEISEILGVPLETIQVIYNPVIGGSFNSLLNEEIPGGICDLADMPLIGFFGRLHPKKRVDTLIRAFALVRKSRQCRLILVGEGSELCKLQRLAQNLGVASDIVFWGFAKNPFPIMKSCDITVLPSAYEGLGNVLVESLACGVQTISTDCPHGPAEILGNGRWGQLVPVGGVAAMAEAIRRSLDREFWVEPSLLRERGLQFTAINATDSYLSALRLPKINPKPLH